MALRTRPARLATTALASAMALGLLAPAPAFAEPPRAVKAAYEDAVPPSYPGYEVIEVPRLAEVKAERYRALVRRAEIRRDLRQAPLRRRVARNGRTVFILYD
jgi:hypothetical protein